MDTRFSLCLRTFLCTEQVRMSLLFLRSGSGLRRDLRNVFDGYALTGIGNAVFVPTLWYFRNFNIANKTVANGNPLGTAFAYALCFKHVDMVDKLLSSGRVIVYTLRNRQTAFTNASCPCFNSSASASSFRSRPILFFSSNRSVSYFCDMCINHSSEILFSA